MYMGPYMVKNKFPMIHSLTILRDTLEDIKMYPSQAEDSGTTKQTAKHVMQRVINKIHLKQELSSYQIAASVIGLESVICSDSFIYSDPLADMAYNTHMQNEADQKKL